MNNNNQTQFQGQNNQSSEVPTIWSTQVAIFSQILGYRLVHGLDVKTLNREFLQDLAYLAEMSATTIVQSYGQVGQRTQGESLRRAS